MPAVALHQSHGAGIGIGEDALAAMLRDQLLPAGTDPLDCICPADRSKFTGTLGAGPQKRGHQAAGRVNRIFVMVHLGAEQAAGDRVFMVAGHSNGAAVLHFHQQAAGIGTVVGADGTMYGHGILVLKSYSFSVGCIS